MAEDLSSFINDADGIRSERDDRKAFDALYCQDRAGLPYDFESLISAKVHSTHGARP
jgi:hypothetical protein